MPKVYLLCFMIPAFAFAGISRACADDAREFPTPPTRHLILGTEVAARPSDIPPPSPTLDRPGPVTTRWWSSAAAKAPVEPSPALGSETESGAGDRGQSAAANRSRSDGIRPYLAMRLAKVAYTGPESASGAELESPSGEPLMGAAFGVNWGRHWGAELAVDFVETDIGIANRTRKVAEYGFWTALAQLRYRYPILDGKLTPYALLGAGLGVGEVNDRNVSRRNISLGGDLDTSFVGAVGAGVEYLVTDNMALGLEAQHRFLADTEIQVDGQSQELSLDSVAVSAVLRVFFDAVESEADAPGSSRGDGDAIRGYLLLGAGGAFFTDPDNGSGVALDSPAPYLGFSLGVNLGRYWGLELAGDAVETIISAPGSVRSGNLRS